MPGKVYLVGAGPGDPGLFTLKGKSVLARADCIVYDFLASPELLRWARPQAEKVYVGKRGGEHPVPQREINTLLIDRARAGKVVVRLKGGDPFIFGRGGEEAVALVRAEIPFEVVPGVTSGSAAPAYAGIPVTHREFASAVSFVTGHTDPARQSAAPDWDHLPALPGTLVFFMGVKNLPEIVAQLLAGGRSPETPVAVIRWGTRPDQRVTVGILADIVSKTAETEPPAIIVVGEVVKLRDQLNWFERLPLFGKRVVVTRSREQAGDLRDALAELGAHVGEIPTIEIRPPDSWEPLDRAIERLEQFDYLLVTSANGARIFLERLKACGRDVRDLKGLKIGAIGPATAAEFEKTGVRVDFMPRQYRAEGLLEVLVGRRLRGKSFLIPRAKVARDLVPRVLAERGARAEVVTAYETAVPSFAPGELKRLLSPRPDVVAFTSSSTALHFARLLGARKTSSLLRRVAIASIGPITSATVRELGFEVAIEAHESTIPALVEAIRAYCTEPGERRRTRSHAPP